jgi:hypothetical protein
MNRAPYQSLHLLTTYLSHKHSQVSQMISGQSAMGSRNKQAQNRGISAITTQWHHVRLLTPVFQTSEDPLENTGWWSQQ